MVFKQIYRLVGKHSGQGQQGQRGTHPIINGEHKHIIQQERVRMCVPLCDL